MHPAIETEVAINPAPSKTFEILIADDDAQFCRTLRLALTAKGYAVQSVPDGMSALDAVLDRPPDVVLLDWSMPGMDGIQVCQAIRAYSNVPIILLSAHFAISKDLALHAGANDFLRKPFSIADLLSSIHSVLTP